MKQTLSIYYLSFDHIPTICDESSVKDLPKNLILQSRTKHIEIRHDFLRDNTQRRDISLKFVNTEN